MAAVSDKYTVIMKGLIQESIPVEQSNRIVNMIRSVDRHLPSGPLSAQQMSDGIAQVNAEQDIQIQNGQGRRRTKKGSRKHSTRSRKH